MNESIEVGLGDGGNAHIVLEYVSRSDFFLILSFCFDLELDFVTRGLLGGAEMI